MKLESKINDMMGEYIVRGKTKTLKHIEGVIKLIEKECGLIDVAYYGGIGNALAFYEGWENNGEYRKLIVFGHPDISSYYRIGVADYWGVYINGDKSLFVKRRDNNTKDIDGRKLFGKKFVDDSTGKITAINKFFRNKDGEEGKYIYAYTAKSGVQRIPTQTFLQRHTEVDDCYLIK